MARKEVWKPVVGFEGLYRVSGSGAIRSLGRRKSSGNGFYDFPGRILSPGVDSGGYHLVVLCSGGKKFSRRVHSLVFDAFNGVPHNSLDINHKNGVKTDNRIENLEACSRSENMKHAYALGLRNPVGPRS